MKTMILEEAEIMTDPGKEDKAEVQAVRMDQVEEAREGVDPEIENQ